MTPEYMAAGHKAINELFKAYVTGTFDTSYEKVLSNLEPGLRKDVEDAVLYFKPDWEEMCRTTPETMLAIVNDEPLTTRELLLKGLGEMTSKKTVN